MRLRNVASFGVLLLSTGWLGVAQAEVASTASTQNMCIPPSARAALEECPAGASRGKIGRQGNHPRSRLNEAAPETKSGDSGPTGPSLQIDMSTLMGREKVQARTQDLLTREIGILQRLVRNTEADDPRRPDILLRLAETQFEMQQSQTAKVRSYDDPIWQACDRDKDKPNCNAQRQGQSGAEGALDKTRQETIRTYATLVRDHPDFDRMDEVLFSLAFGLGEMKRHEEARKVYRRLIKEFPRSRFIPHAYLSFAEFYFAEGDMASAAQFYKRVLKFPPNRNSVYGYALYKSAWVEYNRERYQAALQGFVDVLEFARKNPRAVDAKNLAKQARKELVLPYSRVGKPSRALDFFRRFAKNDAEAHEMLENLGQLYFDTGQWPQAITVYHKLMADAPRDDKLCAWQSQVTNAVISSRSTREQLVELKRLVDINRTYAKGGKRPANLVQECKAETATALVWLSTSWHREAVGTDKQPGTRDKRTMGNAAILYRTLLKEFPDMEQIEFDSIRKEDWPTKYKISYYYAELLWKKDDWGQCGPAFDAVVEEDPQGEFTSDAAYAAVLCYNNLYKQQYRPRERTTWTSKTDAQKKEDKFASREFTELEKGMLNSFSRYMCYVEESDELVQIKYRRARIYYESNRFDEAAVLFRDIAFNHKDSEFSEYAANLYLDCLNILGTQVTPPRDACLGELTASIDPMADAFCGNPQTADQHPDLCGTLSTLQCQTRRKQAEIYERKGDFKRAASTYVRIYRRNADCGEMDEVLYNAAINFEAARLLGRAIQVRKVLIEKHPESEWSKRAVYLIGANYHALAYYEQAAKYYEEFARKFPGEDGKDCTQKEKDAGTCTNAIEALENAVFFRLGLSDDKRALDDANLFARNYGRRLSQKTSQVVFSVGSVYERQGRLDQVISHYKRYLKDYGRSALPHQEILANQAIGEAYWKLNKRREARIYFKAAVKEWATGAPKKIDRLRDVSKGEKTRFLREALDGAAASQFHLSEYSFEAFKAVKFPQYRGGRKMASVNKWAKGDFARWVKKKAGALQAAEREYNEVASMSAKLANGVKMESAPWQIAAASRVGEMYRSFVDEFRDAPIPREIEKDAQLYDIYVGALDEQSEPLQKQAISKFEFCVKTATNVRWFNKWSRSCEEELNRLNPRDYPVAAELRGGADHVKSTLGQPRPAELGTSSAADGEEGGES